MICTRKGSQRSGPGAHRRRQMAACCRAAGIATREDVPARGHGLGKGWEWRHNRLVLGGQTTPSG